MFSALVVLLIAAAITAAVGFWVLRAYRRAGGGARTALPALAACGAVAIAALVAYLTVGRPELPGQPYRARLEALKHRDPTSFTAEEALAVLGEAARDNPADALPHFYSGEVLLNMGRAQEAAREYDAALRRQPRLGEAMLGMGRALVRIEGRVTPEALALFQQAGVLTDDPAPWIYQAMVAIEQNRVADERRFWREALARMGPGDPRRAMAERMSRGGR